MFPAQVFLHAPQLWPAAALAAAIMLAAVLLLYPAQLGGIGWPWRGLLPGLRILAVLAIAASVLKPVAMRLATAEERGAVVVLVDRSRSMAVVDNSRTPAQLVALADALGKLPHNVRSDAPTALATGLERLRTLAANVRGAQEDLDYARVSGRDIQLRQTRLEQTSARYGETAGALLKNAGALTNADDLVKKLSQVAHPPAIASRDAWRTQAPAAIAQAAAAVVRFQNESDKRLYDSNADVRKACDAVATLSRFSLVETALLRPGGVLEHARREAQVTGFGLAGDVTPLPLLQGKGQVVKLDAAPDGDESDLTAGIARAVAGRPVRAVLLFSDGRQIGGDPTVVSGFTPNGVPVFTISATAPDPPRDLSFAKITAPASVFAGQRMTVKVALRHAGFGDAEVNLHCQIGDGPEQVHKISIIDSKPAETEFPARMLKPGVQRIRLWFPPVKGEATADNNHVERWVKVVPERMKVLLIAGSPTWDFQYVRSALGRLQEVQLKEMIVNPAQPRLYIATQEILSQDVIVLFDVPAAAFDAKHWDAIERMAQVVGGSVVLVVSDPHLVGEYAKAIPTSTLLPFRGSFTPIWKPWPGDEPAFHFVPAPEAESLDLLRLPAETETEPDAVARRWEQLPGFFHYLQLPEIRNTAEWKPLVKPLLLEEESRLPVLTEQRLGAGRAFFLGLNETWRWRLKVGERDQEHFWRQLIQYASEDPYFAHAGPLALDADKVSAEPLEPIHIRARIIEEVPDSRAEYSLQVLRDGQKVADTPLAPSGPAGGGRYAATLSLPAGDYNIQWIVPAAMRKTHTVKMPLHVASTSEAELADLTGDAPMLRKLAEASGGEYFTLEQIDRLPERLAAAGDARSRFAEMSLWDSPYLFLLVIGCLGTEWALRKRLGLA